MLSMLALMSLASAQTVDAGVVPDINAQYFRPSLDANRTFWTDDTSLSEDLLSPKLLLHYTDRPLVYAFDDGTDVALVSGVAQADLMLSASFSRYRIGVDVPIYLVADGVLASSEFGLGDLAVDAKAVVLDGADADVPVGLAVSGRLFLPTATVDNALGAPNVGWELAAIVDKRFLDERALLAANVAFRGAPKTELENVTIDDYLAWRAGGAYDLSRFVALSAELVGGYSLPGAGDSSALPVEALFGGHFLAKDTAVRLGIGPGLTSGIGAPNWRAMIGVDFLGSTPEPDTDLDGLPDSIDACPDVAEDLDGVLDDDGCFDAPTPVTVTVVDGAGAPIAGASVSVKMAEAPVHDGPGGQAFTVEPGSYELTAMADGYVSKAMSFEAAPAEEAKGLTVTLELVSGTLRLTAVDAAGQPVDAKLFFAGEEIGEGSTFDGPIPAGKGRALARAEGYKVAFVDVEITPDAVTEVSLLMAPSQADLVGDRIDIKDSVYFDTGKASIQERSFGLLDEVAAILTDHPELTKLRVEGHTDSRGGAASNKALSQKRADAVVAYLVGKGVDAARLDAVGFGEDKPIDPASTAAAYEKNRRVDFFVEERAD